MAKKKQPTVPKVRSHFTWSIESGDGRCPVCDERTVLIVAPPNWSTDSEPFADGLPAPDDFPEDVDVHDEVTGHFCLKCDRLVSLSLNTLP